MAARRRLPSIQVEMATKCTATISSSRRLRAPLMSGTSVTVIGIRRTAVSVTASAAPASVAPRIS